MRAFAAVLTLTLATSSAVGQGVPRHPRLVGFAVTGVAYPWPVRAWGYVPPPVPLVVVVPQPVFVVPAVAEVEPDPPPAKANWHVIRPLKQLAFPAVARPDVVAGPVAAVGDRDPNPMREAARQVRLAQAAFAADEYGRAVERLDEAIRVQPKEPLPYFLLAQVRIARGEYAEAAAAVRDGLAVAPDWPATDFTPKPLYANLARFDDHLRDLREAVADRPNDGTLLFLLAHELWFTGSRDEARKLFRRLLPAKEKGLIEAYLNVADGRVVKQ